MNNSEYTIVLSKSEITTMRLMLKVLLGHWVKDSTDDYLKVEASERTRPTASALLTKRLIANTAIYRDLDYALMMLLGRPEPTVFMTCNEKRFKKYCQLVKIIPDICKTSNMEEAENLKPLLLTVVPALRAAFEVAIDNAEKTISPEGTFWHHFGRLKGIPPC